MSPSEFVYRYVWTRSTRRVRRGMSVAEFEEWMETRFDPWLDFGVMVGLAVLLLVAGLNVRVCLDIYEAAGPKFGDAGGWCN